LMCLLAFVDGVGVYKKSALHEQSTLELVYLGS